LPMSRTLTPFSFCGKGNAGIKERKQGEENLEARIKTKKKKKKPKNEGGSTT